MQPDSLILYILGGVYAFTIGLILYQIEIRWHPLAKIKCRFGFHKRPKYRCVYCKKPKDHPHLTVIDGGKKDIEVKFRF